MARIGIVMGSDSDLKIVKKAADLLDQFDVEYETIIASAHRVPARVEEYASTARERGVEVIIAAAGMAAHLPGVIAAQTVLPVIGLPIGGGALSGLDALYSIVQMPKGIPVATVGIDNGQNAALLALQILAVSDASLTAKLGDYKEKMKREVDVKHERLQKFGIEGYLKTK